MRSPEITCRWITRDTDDDQQWLEMRREILRAPLGLDFSARDLLDERLDRQLIARDEKSGDLVGGVMIRESSDGISWKVRQMAVKPEHQGKGFGRALLEQLERTAREEGIRELHLHARDEAVPFYEKLGFVAEGPEFIEVTIPHRRLAKPLIPPP
ncbi:MAG: GNAT family N-acetyltransferase [Verrucomicrobiota bacterium]